MFNETGIATMQNQQPQAADSSLVEIFGEPIHTYSAYSTPIPPYISVQTLPAIPAETGHPLHLKPYHPFQSKVGHPFQSKPAAQAG